MCCYVLDDQLVVLQLVDKVGIAIAGSGYHAVSW